MGWVQIIHRSRRWVMACQSGRLATLWPAQPSWYRASTLMDQWNRNRVLECTALKVGLYANERPFKLSIVQIPEGRGEENASHSIDSRSGRCLAGQLPGTPGFPASTWTVLASPAGTCWLIDRLNNISSTIWPVSEWHVCTWPQQPWRAVSWWTDCWAAWAAWWAAFWPPCLSPQLPSSVPWPAYLVVAHLKNQKACSWMITVSTVDSWHIRECISYLATDLKSQIFSSYVVNSQNFLGSFFVKVSLLGTSRGWSGVLHNEWLSLVPVWACIPLREGYS